jgi:hypothetical protein
LEFNQVKEQKAMSYNLAGWKTLEGEVLSTQGKTIWMNVDGKEVPINTEKGIEKHVRTGHRLKVMTDKAGNLVRVNNLTSELFYRENYSTQAHWARLLIDSGIVVIISVIPLIGQLIAMMIGLLALLSTLVGSMPNKGARLAIITATLTAYVVAIGMWLGGAMPKHDAGLWTQVAIGLASFVGFVTLILNEKKLSRSLDQLVLAKD